MPIDIADAVRGGYDRTVARTGLLFAGAFYVVSLLDGVFSPALEGRMPPEAMGVGMAPGPTGGMGPYAPSLGVSPAVAAVVSLLLFLVSLVLTIAATRTFVSGEAEEIPREYFTRNLGWAALNLIVGGLVFGIVVGIGFVLLVVPGLFLLVSLFLWEVPVVVEDRNFLEGFRESWALTGGDRLRLFGLGVVVVIVGLVVSALFGLPGLVLPDVLGYLISRIGSAFLGVFVLATVAEAYTQLRAAADG